MVDTTVCWLCSVACIRCWHVSCSKSACRVGLSRCGMMRRCRSWLPWTALLAPLWQAQWPATSTFMMICQALRSLERHKSRCCAVPSLSPAVLPKAAHAWRLDCGHASRTMKDAYRRSCFDLPPLCTPCIASPLQLSQLPNTACCVICWCRTEQPPAYINDLKEQVKVRALVLAG